jgi:nicotinamidase-related amidase
MAVDRFASPALVVVDMQNDFVREGAPLEVADSRETIPQIQRLLRLFRQKRWAVVFLRFIGGPKRTLIWEWSAQLEPETKLCWLDHKRVYKDAQRELSCVDVVDELSPILGEYVVDKYGYGGFHNTNLASVLEANQVQSLVVVGTVTQICVEDTVRQGMHLGYPITVAADGVSSFDSELHAATLRNIGMKYGWVSTTSEIVNELEGR